MAGNIEIRVPSSENEPMRFLRKISPQNFDDLLLSLQAASPRLKGDDFARQVAANFAKFGNATEAQSIAEMAVRAARALHLDGDARADVLADLIELAFDKDEAHEAQIVDLLKERILRLTAPMSVRITSEANTFLTSQPAAFLDANIFTDIRPIYVRGAEATEPTASVLIQQLQFSVWNGSSRELTQISLDEKDLLRLRNLADYALKRGQSLRASELSTNRVVIEP